MDSNHTSDRQQMTWWDTKEQRKKNRTNKGREFEEARALRRHGWRVLLERKSGEVVCQAKDGCFGRLLTLDPDTYNAWALGTRGERAL